MKSLRLGMGTFPNTKGQGSTLEFHIPQPKINRKTFFFISKYLYDMVLPNNSVESAADFSPNMNKNMV